MELILYLSYGYPTIEASEEMASRYVDAGCDIIEVDLPAKNPYLESDYIKERMHQALNNNDNYDDYMAGIIRIKEAHPNTKFILLAYEETVQEIGEDKFIKFCKDNEILDLIYVGFKTDTLKNKLIEHGLRVSCYIQHHLPSEEVKSALHSNGFVYLQAKPANNRICPKYPTLATILKHLNTLITDRPIYTGVGISTEEDVAYAKESGADAVFVGSTILKLHSDPMAMKEKIKSFKANC
jgi:tryptophan synthase alpha chain